MNPGTMALKPLIHPFLLIHKEDYRLNICPAVQQLKFKYFGHDNIILHEREIRKSEPPFEFLRQSKEVRKNFLNDISSLMDNVDIEVFASVIDKNRLLKKYSNPWNPYEIAMHFLLEGILFSLKRKKQKGSVADIVFEKRGRVEDNELELEFRRIVANESHWGYKKYDFTEIVFRPHFVSKKANLPGLQLADLIARPLANRVLYPGQSNKALDIIWPKIRKFKIFP